jgi:acyl-CoA-binding protein
MSIENKFKEAQERVKTLAQQPDNDVLLKLYSLYKQSTLGDAGGKKPGAFDFVAKAKFEAWSSLKGMTQETAMSEYVKLVDELSDGS